MERKKIVIVSTSDPTYDQRLIKIATSLAKEFDVLWLGRLQDASTVKHFPFQVKAINPIIKSSFLFYLFFNLRVFCYLLFQSFTILNANDTDTLLAAILLKPIKSFYLIFDSHELFDEVPELKNATFKKRIWNIIEKWGVNKSNFRFTVNDSLAQILSKKHQIQFSVIQNVPVLKEYECQPAEEKYLLYQGAINKGRGLHEIISIMPSISLPLYIAGDGDIKEELEEEVKRLGLEHKVKFLGKIKPSDLREITAKAYIGINLLQNSSLNYYYSSANKFFDYIHADLPQIGMNFPEYTSINIKYKVAILVDDLAKDKLHNAIQTLIENKSLYEELKANCQQAKMAYQWTNEEKKLILIYLSIIWRHHRKLPDYIKK